MHEGKRSRWWLAAKIVAVPLGIVAGIYAYQGLVRLASLDPLASYRNAGDSAIAMRMSNVEIRQYSRANLVATALIDTVEVSRDRNVSWLKTIRNGQYRSENGRVIRFEAGEGVWNQLGQVFLVRKAVHAHNQDLNLKSDQLQYEARTGIVRLPGKVAGDFVGGKLDATNLAYHLPSGTFEIGPVTWVGKVKLQDDVPAEKQNQLWTIKASGATRGANNVEIWKNAQATDGDVIVRAERIERNVKTDILVATGNVRYFSRDANMLAEKLTVFRKEKRAVAEGNISMLIKAEGDQKLEVVEIAPLRPVVPESISVTRPPAPSPEERQLDDEVRGSGNRRKYPTQVYAQRIEYWYRRGERRARITGSPQARQELPGGRWRQAWCAEAFYDREKETLKMMSAGNKETRVKTSLGDDLRATWFLVSTKEGDDSWEAADLEGTVATDDDDLRNNRGNSTPPPTGSGGTGGLRGRIGGG